MFRKLCAPSEAVNHFNSILIINTIYKELEYLHVVITALHSVYKTTHRYAV